MWELSGENDLSLSLDLAMMTCAFVFGETCDLALDEGEEERASRVKDEGDKETKRREELERGMEEEEGGRDVRSSPSPSPSFSLLPFSPSLHSLTSFHTPLSWLGKEEGEEGGGEEGGLPSKFGLFSR